MVKLLKSENMENLIGQMVHVVVSKDGKKGTKILKVCKVKARSVLFIEVDRENRKNIFRKVSNKDITTTAVTYTHLTLPTILRVEYPYVF